MHVDGRRMFVDCFGGGAYQITVGQRTIIFEWSYIFGPIPITKTGKVLELSPRHKFFSAASLWNIQGQRIDGTKAIWHEPKQPVIENIGVNNYKIIEPGETGWDW